MRVLLTLLLVLAAFLGTVKAATPAVPSFRLDIANELRTFSQTSYCSARSVAKWHCPTCKTGSLENFQLTNRFADPRTNTFGFAGFAQAAREKVIIFSFRGATPNRRRNWITELNSELRPYPGLKGAAVQKSFYDTYETISESVQLAAKSLLAQCPGCHIYVTGHSLGGAIATLAASDMYTLTPDLSVYTFGAPRVGNVEFATYLDKILPDSFRVVNQRDVVPHLPQRLLGFQHSGTEIWFSNPRAAQSKYVVCHLGEDDSCSNSLVHHINTKNIHDHGLYLDKPMGCRKRDISQMKKFNRWQSFVEQSNTPFDKLASKVESDSQIAAEADALVEADAQAEAFADEPALVEVDASRAYSSEDLLEALADEQAYRMKISGGKQLFPARLLDPLSRPESQVLSGIFSKIERTWNKLPFSWNPHVKAELAEAKWRAENRPPK